MNSASSVQKPDLSHLPSHLAIIMDGNGRWAKNRGLIRSKGHLEGLSSAKKIAQAAAELGIKYLTLYVFSTENWKRTEQEVGYLMNLIRSHLRSEFEFYKTNRIRIEHLGDLNGLPPDIQAEITKAREETKDFTGLTLTLAINYGGRNEIVRAIKKCASLDNIDKIKVENFGTYFDIPELPDVDLLIRTGGEKRLSNYLLWHASYAELIFTDTLWPDYTETELYENIIEFQKRNRRFGNAPV